MREDCKEGKVSMVLSSVVESLIGLPGFRYVGNVYNLGLGLEKEKSMKQLELGSKELGSEAAAAT